MNTKKRTRLSPADRRAQLLDCAVTIIQDRGLSSFTMEALAKEAEVSSPLIYKYFDTRLELLQELLTREHERYSSDIQQQVEKAESYDEVVRIVVSTNFDQASKGNILYVLRSQPDVRPAIKEIETKQSKRFARFLVKSLADEYPLTRKQAEEITVFASGASQAAAEHYGRFGGNREALIENVVQFIFGGIETFVP